jgi:hypothetical protein
VAAGARVVSVAAVAGGAWASGVEALAPSCDAASLQDFVVIRDPSLDRHSRGFPVLRLIRQVSTQTRTP